MVTESERVCKSAPSDAEASPLPNEDNTPPVTKINFVFIGLPYYAAPSKRKNGILARSEDFIRKKLLNMLLKKIKLILYVMIFTITVFYKDNTMQTRLYLPLILLLLLALPACQQSGNAPKIVVVDMNRIMRDSEPAKAGVKFLESLHTDMQEKINAIQERLAKKPNDESTQKELQSVYMTAQQRMQTEQQNVINLLNDAIQRVINQCREQNGYDIVINVEMTASYNAAVDVTAEIIEQVNKLTITFKPTVEETAPAVVPDAPGGDARPAAKTPKK